MAPILAMSSSSNVDVLAHVVVAAIFAFGHSRDPLALSGGIRIRLQVTKSQSFTHRARGLVLQPRVVIPTQARGSLRYAFFIPRLIV